jgi:hypothetical protein
LIVAGDAAYNGDHLHLSESPDQQKRQEWIAALDKMDGSAFNLHKNRFTQRT